MLIIFDTQINICLFSGDKLQLFCRLSLDIAVKTILRGAFK